MGWYALEEIDGTLSDVKEFLLPFNFVRWSKLALIALFVGAGFTSFPGAPTNIGPGSTGGAVPDLGISTAVLALIVVTVAGVLAIFSYLSSVFEFIFYRSIADKEVRLKSSFREHYLDGLKLFGFNLATAAAGLASLAVLVGSAMYSIWVAVGVFFVLLPLWFLIWAVSFFVSNYTVPDIVVEEKGFLEALKDTASSVRSEWRQSALFVVFYIALGLGSSVITGAVIIGGLLLIGIPLVLIGILLGAIWTPLVLIPLVIGVIGIVLISLGVSVPVQTYIYQWVLNVYRRYGE